MTLADVRDLCSFDNWAVSQRIVDILLHIVNHSTYHRGQVTTLLRQVGAVPPETDFVVFRERGLS
jgi:uncharacterized damage-inducible protein DinB